MTLDEKPKCDDCDCESLNLVKVKSGDYCEKCIHKTHIIPETQPLAAEAVARKWKDVKEYYLAGGKNYFCIKHNTEHGTVICPRCKPEIIQYELTSALVTREAYLAKCAEVEKLKEACQLSGKALMKLAKDSHGILKEQKEEITKLKQENAKLKTTEGLLNEPIGNEEIREMIRRLNSWGYHIGHREIKEEIESLKAECLALRAALEKVCWETGTSTEAHHTALSALQKYIARDK